MNRIKIGICIGLTCLILVGCQEGIRNYIGAVGLTRVHADEITVCRSNSPSTSSFIEKLGKSIRHALYASAREVYGQGRTGEASASDRGSDVGTAEYDVEGDVLPQEEPADLGADIDVYQEDSWEGLTYLGAWTATAYCSCVACTTDGNGYTASGTIATEGRTVASNTIPLGSRILVNGCEYVVEDTGYTPFGDAWLDFYFDSHLDALAFGVQTVDVYLID